MATVYLAHDLKHDRDVAIKVLHPDLGAALDSERFLSEIRTTARLQHPHILPLLDSGEADGLLYYVMPLVTGETLRTRLERERQLPIADAIRIAREVASALDYAHRQNVIHRDIKPENILLHDGQAIVADFGIALAVQSAGGARMTQTGLSLGTPQYMSPEQAIGEKTIDARSRPIGSTTRKSSSTRWDAKDSLPAHARASAPRAETHHAPHSSRPRCSPSSRVPQDSAGGAPRTAPPPALPCRCSSPLMNRRERTSRRRMRPSTFRRPGDASPSSPETARASLARMYVLSTTCARIASTAPKASRKYSSRPTARGWRLRRTGSSKGPRHGRQH